MTMKWTERRTKFGYELTLTTRVDGTRLTIVEVIPFGLKRLTRLNVIHIARELMSRSIASAERAVRIAALQSR